MSGNRGHRPFRQTGAGPGRRRERRGCRPSGRTERIQEDRGGQGSGSRGKDVEDPRGESRPEDGGDSGNFRKRHRRTGMKRGSRGRTGSGAEKRSEETHRAAALARYASQCARRPGTRYGTGPGNRDRRGGFRQSRVRGRRRGTQAGIPRFPSGERRSGGDPQEPRVDLLIDFMSRGIHRGRIPQDFLLTSGKVPGSEGSARTGSDGDAPGRRRQDLEHRRTQPITRPTYAEIALKGRNAPYGRRTAGPRRPHGRHVRHRAVLYTVLLRGQVRPGTEFPGRGADNAGNALGNGSPAVRPSAGTVDATGIRVKTRSGAFLRVATS